MPCQIVSVTKVWKRTCRKGLSLLQHTIGLSLGSLNQSAAMKRGGDELCSGYRCLGKAEEEGRSGLTDLKGCVRRLATKKPPATTAEEV